MHKRNSIKGRGFTIVELLIVIVVIAILAAIIIVSYNGMISRARDASVKSDTAQNAQAMSAYEVANGSYASNCATAGVKGSPDNTLTCSSSADGTHFCVSASHDTISYYATEANLTPQAGGCSGSTGFVAGSALTTIAAGQAETCGVSVSGRAYCWGENWAGQLGNGTTTNSTTPVNVAGALSGKTVTDIAIGDEHACAVADGAAYCWGSGDRGQLGNGTTTNSSTPVAVDTSGVLAGKTVTKVAANGKQTCVIANGAAYCFGDMYRGALGNNISTQTNQTTPVAVDTSGVLAGKTVTDISIGGYYAYNACAVASGKAYCWGANDWGQLGTGTTVDASVPVAVDTSGVLSGKTVTDIAMYEYHACAVASGKAYCWGANGDGYLGNGQIDNTNVFPPVAVDTSGVLAGKTVTAIAPGDYHTCAIASGAAYCWGNWSYGALGYNATTDQLVPAAVDTSGALAGKTVTAIASGYGHTCVVASSLADCWGQSWGGALGNGVDAASTTPVPVLPMP